MYNVKFMELGMSMCRNTAMSAPKLSEDEERKALRDYAATCCPKALKALVSSHSRMAFAEARKWARQGTELSDFASAGIVGLIEAARRFDQDKSNGGRFATYASYWVMRAVQDEVIQMRHPMRVSRDAIFSAVRKGKTEAEQAVTVQAVNQVICLDKAVEGTAESIGSLMPWDGPTPEEEVVDASCAHQMRQMIDKASLCLDTASREIILRHKLGSEDPIEVVAEDLGISCDRARRLRDRAFLQMRQALLSQGFTPKAFS